MFIQSRDYNWLKRHRNGRKIMTFQLYIRNGEQSRTMKKVFLFDMDGVIINSESVWELRENRFLSKVLGEEIYKKIKPEILGSTFNAVYELARKNGFPMKKEELANLYDKESIKVYLKAKLTK